MLFVAAECGDLDDLLAECDVDYAETPSDDPGVVEKLVNLSGRCSRGDVEILGYYNSQLLNNPFTLWKKGEESANQ